MKADTYLSTDKDGIQTLCRILAEKGVEQAVLSPGSRNAPLLVAFAREPRIRHFVIVDERCAAYFALGLAQQSRKATVLVCTSGTALLNYIPAVAEAYYQQIPLIVLSADRPEEWIDQDDCQTVRQTDALRPFVKEAFRIDADPQTETRRWFNRRVTNEAFNLAVSGAPGPVHINIPIDDPLCGTRSYPDSRPPLFGRTEPEERFGTETLKELTATLNACRRILIVAGYMPPDPALNRILHRWSQQENCVVVTENLANLNASTFIATTDRLLAVVRGEGEEKYRPDLIISFGGSLISKRIKTFLRRCPETTEHWSLDKRLRPADPFMHLTRQLPVSPEPFFRQLLPHLSSVDSDYARLWSQCNRTARERHDRFMAQAEWSDLQAFDRILKAVPAGCRLQISNGTAIRYAQLFEETKAERRNGNRGTSGIDGSTSTAVGAAVNHPGITVLISGDMSFLYDANGLSIPYISPSLKIIVMQNGGGGIFRYLPGPSDLEELESCFETPRDIPLEKYADLHDFRYFEANRVTDLEQCLPAFFAERDKCALLAVRTPRFDNAPVLNRYFDFLEKNSLSNP